jgi:hypothetical protein
LAAVNSSIKPHDLGEAHGLTLADMLLPAISKYGSFPLVKRRYPRQLADLAFDLFLGKPAVLVEHHGYFRDGYADIRDFMNRLNALSSDLHWMGIGEVVRHTYLLRSTSPFSVECRIFANRQCIENPSKVEKRIVIFKAEDGETPIKKVTVGGKHYPYVIENGQMRLEVDVPPTSALKIAIDYSCERKNRNNIAQNSLKQSVKVYLRRHLSEVRDNYLSKHERLLSIAYRVKNAGRLGL